VSTVQVRAAAPVFWAASVALTRKVCVPSGRLEAVKGELQAWKPPLSSWQRRLAPDSFEEKPKVGV
jgi:hypothetical protein